MFYAALRLFLILQFSLYTGQSLGRVGSPSDVTTTTTAGTVLMGGGSDVDAAFTWMINKSGGGDFVVIRASGGSGYNSYIYGLGNANSVETFLINSLNLANDNVLVNKVLKAEAIFFAGGDQNDYISFYKNTLLGDALNYLANTKNIPIGGTSAGMAIQGKIYYDGITNVLSSEVLNNPYASGTGIKYNDFLQNPFLINTICDTHFNVKGGTTANGITGRQGRLMSFLARIITDQNIPEPKGIACDEKTAVCIDENGNAMVVGFGKAYFLKKYCNTPEICINNQPLDWSNGTKVYIIQAPGSYSSPPTLAKFFNLNDWSTGIGGNFEYWNVNNGTLSIGNINPFPTLCTLAVADQNFDNQLIVYPNPTSSIINLVNYTSAIKSLKLHDASGKLLLSFKSESKINAKIDISFLQNGHYYLHIGLVDKIVLKKVIKK